MARASVLALALGAAACASKGGIISPVITEHGYVQEQEKVDSLKVGETTMAKAKETLGTPSSMSAFNDHIWYYISQTQESLAFFQTQTTDRNVLALEFDAQGKLASVDRYDIKDGRVVNYSGRETPTRGKELTFLEQMFGNVGRGLPGGAGNNANDGLSIPNPNQRRR